MLDPASGETGWQPLPPRVDGSHTVYRYRPRCEGLFARIERWVLVDSGETHWRSISRDNVTSLYGRSAAGRLADPADARRVYEWLLEETFDAFGNHVRYDYAQDDPALYGGGGPGALPEPYEQRRAATQRYLRRIFYGNLPVPLLDGEGRPVTHDDGSPVGPLRNGRRYVFEVVFDYGDWDTPTTLPHPEPPGEDGPELFGADAPAAGAARAVPLREDRFSSFRAGFEIRTLRRCRRVLMFHHFAELGGPTLVRSTDLAYHTDPDTRLSLLRAVTVTGYSKQATGEYRSANLPPVTFAYAEFKPHEQRYQRLATRGDHLPPPLSDPDTALVDLSGDGLPDVVQGSGSGFRVWRNLGNGLLDRPRPLATLPAGLALGQPGVGFGDMGGDGRTDLLVQAAPLSGFFETTAAGAWRRFVPFATDPGFDLHGADLRLLDLTGDGRSDALITADDHFLWFQCLGEKGYAPGRSLRRIRDLDEFPDVHFDDPAGRVHLADMSGDGLQDIVLVHNGRIDYWPNQGYGRFGKRVAMANAPRLEQDFDPRRLFFVDLDGSGCADLVCVDSRRVHFWFNQAGNGWSERQTIQGMPAVDETTALRFADVFGTGTATLLWSPGEGSARDRHYRALDFCGGAKPYVLTEMDNNLGATTRVSYAPSTQFFLADRANGTPWASTLPFPVNVVEKVEVIDHVGKTKLVTRYAYHHGCYDGREREFRGFGRVDQFDTESFDDFTGAGLHGPRALFANGEAAYQQPPVETRSWFHTGIYFDDGESGGLDHAQLSVRFRHEYYPGDGEALPLPDHDIETADAPHEAYRMLRGAQLRSEVYAHDGSRRAAHPYQVTESRFRVRPIQPREGNRHGVFFSHALESVTHHYERNPSDPRSAHALTLETDGFGNPLRTLAIAYGRRWPDPTLPSPADRDSQSRTLITYTESRYTNAIDDPSGHYRTPALCETRAYELTGFQPAQGGAQFSFGEWTAERFARIDGAPAIEYESAPDPTLPQKRLVEHARTRYRADDLSDLLPLGRLEPLALPGEDTKLAFTPGLLQQVYGDRVTPAMLAGEGGYVQDQGEEKWWIPSGRVFYSPGIGDTAADELAFARQHVFRPHRARDPFGNPSFLRYDAYSLLAAETTDALGNRSATEYDYRLLQPLRATDANGNRTEVVYDTLGLLAGIAVMGKPGEGQGDSLAGFPADIAPQQLDAFFADPLGQASALLGNATSRVVHDVHRYARLGQPVVAATLARETHASDPLPEAGLKVQVAVAYSDGAGREIQKKIQAEPGPLTEGGAEVSPRWVGSGWTIFNNKGKAVRQYEPFFDDSHAFRFGRAMGVASTLFYDPLGRVVATLHPNHTWAKVLFDAWRQETWDTNDTSLIDDPSADAEAGAFFRRLAAPDYLPTWQAERRTGALGPFEQAAAEQAALHAATPAVTHANALGRTFLTIAHNRRAERAAPQDEFYFTRAQFDIEGNPRQVTDARDRIVVRYDYDLLGRQMRQSSMEAGERRALADAAGQPLFAWDSRGHRFRTTYDALRRPLDVALRSADGGERVIGQTIYGEARANAEALNLRGRVFLHRDQAGVVASEAYDFKGNLLASQRQFARDYKNTLDWSADPELDAQVFATRTAYDALNRPLAVTAPDGSVYHPRFNAASLLEKVDVHLRGAATATEFVTNVDYDAKGQRTLVEFGNGARTRTTYDPATFRLARLETLRGTERLQDLRYVYDPAGNITHIDDGAQQTLFFGNQAVAPHADYAYDALYRLAIAEGREHAGQAARPATSWDDPFRLRLPHPHDGRAMRRYTERYEYDAVGNLLQILHQVGNGNWTRSYTYAEASLIEPDKLGNRLSSTAVGSGSAETYRYDAHGNMTAMPHLPAMAWNHQDRLQHVDLGGGGDAYCVYDATGQRARKVVERNGGTLIEERLYLGGFEVFRRRNAAGNITLERETLHVMDGGQRIAIVETRNLGDARDGPAQSLRYQFANHLGSAALELDEAGRIISYEEYYPYGSTSYQAGRSAAETSLKRYRYTGMERDEETGLACHGARYYAAWLGRWASADPIGIKDGPNLYVYGHCNPLQFRDLNGFQNTPGNFVEYANNIEQGLNRIAQLGLDQGIEYGLGQDPKTQKLMVLRGNKNLVNFGELTPLGHTHTGNDTTVHPSTADMNVFAKRKVKEHWLFSKDDGWARIRYDAKTKTFDVLRNRGQQAVRFTIFQNPEFDPKDKSPYGRSRRWRSSVEDHQGSFKVEPQPHDSGPRGGTKGFSLSRGVLGKLGGIAFVSIGLLTMSDRYLKAIEKDHSGGTGGSNTLQLMQSDMQAGALTQGVASIGPGPRRLVGAAGAFFMALEVSRMVFGEDDTIRSDPLTGREVRWFYEKDRGGSGLSIGTPHVMDSKAGKWMPATSYGGVWMTDREIEESQNPWK